MAIEKQTSLFGLGSERSYGYAQAVRVGDTIYVSGQTALAPDGEMVGVGDMAAQMRQAYANIERALGDLGADMGNVVEETLFATNVRAASVASRTVRHEVYRGVFEVASTLVQVAALAGPEMLIEIRCTARTG